MPAVRLAAEVGVLVRQLRRKWQRKPGTVSVDDMNAVAETAALAPAR